MEKQISTRQVYDGSAISLRIDGVRKPNGKTTTRDVVEHADCIVAYPVDSYLLEAPAGGVEPGEDILDCVRRELQEEIGYEPRTIERLGGFYSIPGYGTEYLYAYLARDLKPSRLMAEDTDEIEVVKVPLKDIPALIESGKMCDAKSIAALLMYMAREKLLA